MFKKCFLILVVIMGLSVSILAENETINITGEILFKEYKNGDITVYALDENGNTIASVMMEKPGNYVLKVPKDYGNVYIKMSNFNTKENENYVYQLKEPLKAGSSDINKVDIVFNLKSLLSPSLVMATYSGPTVIISGKVIYSKDMPSVEIGIFVWSEKSEKFGHGMSDVTRASISGPGPYSLIVPKNFGKLYIDAILNDGKHTTARYQNNPIEAGENNIEGIDLIFQ